MVAYPGGVDFKTKLGRWMITPITGIPILLGVLYLMYLGIGVFVAQTVVEITEEKLWLLSMNLLFRD